MPKPTVVRKEDPDAFLLFCFATSNWKARWALHRQMKLRYPFNMPIFVAEAFTLELHLKCLIRVRGIKLPKRGTHEIAELYNLLTPQDKRRLVKKKTKLTQDDIDSILERSRGLFALLKYQYEGHEWPLDPKTGKWGNKGFEKLIHAIRDIIKTRQPKWDAKKNAALGIGRKPLSRHTALVES
jgi:hypothetical protein